MIRRLLIPVFLLFLTSHIVQAQTPRSIIVQGEQETIPRTSSRMVCNDAGEITVGPVTGQSNDTDGEPIILCFGDELTIDHISGTEDLSNDPDDSTAGGIGYLFYECQPTIPGDNLAAIRQDDCLFQDPFFTDENGVIIAQIGPDSIWTYTEDRSGDVTFVNDGRLNQGFNNGNPITLWYAPITYDNLSGDSQATYEGDPAGSCVNVSTDQAFSVTYLNEIIIDVKDPIASLPCRGRFEVNGGFPELIEGEEYTNISITAQSDPSIEATNLTVGTEHGETVTFEVSFADIYDITVEDAKGCIVTSTIDMTGCETVSFMAPDVVGRPNQVVCTDITIEEFDNMLGFNFNLEWDASVITFNEITNIHPGLGNGFFNNPDNPGVLAVSWQELNDLDNGTSISPDGEIIFTVCFDVIGNDGDISSIDFTTSNASNTTNGGQEIGLLATAGSVIISDNSIGVMVEAIDISCNGEVDGGFNITVIEGTPPYNYEYFERNGDVIGASQGTGVINNDGDTSNETGLEAGEYAVIVMDSTNPIDVDTVNFEIVEPGLLSIAFADTPLLCAGDSNAVLTVNLARGDVQPIPIPDSELENFTFIWNTGDTTRTIDNLSSGLYSVTVVDENGCTVEDNEFIADPVINPNATTTRATCSGSANGSVEFTPNGGNVPDGTYNFDLIGVVEGVESENFFVGGLECGAYEYVITDDNGCAFRDSIIIECEKELIVTVVDSSHVSCTDGADAFIAVEASVNAGATPTLPWTFEWNGVPPLTQPANSIGNTSRAEMLRSGIYTLRVTDSDPAGCEAVVEYIIGEPAPLVAGDIITTAETCQNGGGDGTATISITGGTRPYTYIWGHDMMMTTDSVRSDLAAGPYDVTVQDNNNCELEIQLTVGSPVPPTVNIVPDTVGCITDTGELTAEVFPGSAGIASIEWEDGRTGQTITGVPPGPILITVTGTDGCITIDTGFVFAPQPITIDSLIATSPSCPGFTDGQFNVFVSQGTEPYQYSWRDAQGNEVGTGAVLAGLTSGDYTLNISDDNNCAPRDTMVSLAEPPSIELSFEDPTAVSCNGGSPCDGQATVMASYSDGSPGLFNFQWESAETTADATSSSAAELCQGFQNVTVTDGEICSVLDSIEIPAPPALNLQINATPVSCFGDTNGTATAIPTGGTPNYTIEWEDASTGETISNQSPGTYAVSVTDANNCMFSTNVTIGEPDSLVAMIGSDQTRDVTCAGGSDGAIFVVATGGNDLQPYDYTYSPMSGSGSSAFVESLVPGTYFVTVTDILGCTDTTSYTVSEPPAIFADIPDIPEPQCFNGQTSILIGDVVGGNGGPFSFSVNNFNPQSIDNSFPINVNGRRDSVLVSIFDSQQCRIDTTLFVTQPQQIQVLFDTDELEVQLGDSTTQLNPTLIGDFPFETFVWTPPTALSDSSIMNPTIRPIESQQYTLTVTDINGCTGVGSIFIDVDKNRNIYIPNAFSPDGDGFNDDFVVGVGLGVTSVNYMRVYDRWGELVYAQENNVPVNGNETVGWDGRVNNQIMNGGVFVYIIEVTFEDGITLLYRGDVTIVH